MSVASVTLGSSSSTSAQLLAYVRAHFHDPSLNAAAAASGQSITTRYLHMLVEDHGVTFSQHVLRLRLERAHELLTDPSLRQHSIAAIACQVGFADLSYFNRTFRRRFGVTPSEARAGAR